MKRHLLFLFAAFCASSTFAAEAPVIKISKSDVIAIAISPIGGADGEVVTKVLRDDLALSGYFSIAPASSAGFIVSGVSNGGSLEGKVVDHSGSSIVASNYSGTARSKAHAFADDIVRTITGNKGISGGRIAFVATRTGRKEIYTADYDGSNVQQLTHDNSINVHPSLSPDGRKLAYTGYKSGYPDIYEVDLASGSRDRIMKYPGTNTGAAYSPDGHRIAATLSKDGNPELYVNGNRLTHTPGVESSPTWSPNGDEIIYTYDGSGTPQLYRISAGGGAGHEISTGHGYCTEPNWSPDGKKVAFNVRDGGFQIAVLDLQSGSTRVVASGENPVWGPDSRHILFAEGGALYLLDAQTGKKAKVLDGLGKITEPTWSR